MRALTWRGRRDVRVSTVPDPTIVDPTDAIIRVTSTGLCGSDLHLYELLGPFTGDILGHEPMGIVEAVGREVDSIKPRERVVVPSTFPVDRAGCALSGCSRSARPPRSTRTGRAVPCWATRSSTARSPVARQSTCASHAHYGPIVVTPWPPDEQFLLLSDVLPTAWQAVDYAAVPNGGSVAVLGLGPIGQMSARVAIHCGAARVFGVDLVPARLEIARRHGVDVIDLTNCSDLGDELRERTGGRGPDSVIDAVGMEAPWLARGEGGTRPRRSAPQPARHAAHGTGGC